MSRRRRPVKITKDNLLGSDWNTLFTRDPDTFFEAVLINILWGKDGKDLDQAQIAKQRFIFEKWHEYYGANLRIDIENEIKAKLQPELDKAEARGNLAGRINALQNLPFKRSGLGKVVDINAVTELLRQLKAEEPIGVVKDGEQATS